MARRWGLHARANCWPPARAQTSHNYMATPALNKPCRNLKPFAGAEVTPAAFAGKTVVLYFYPKDNTPGCTTEAMQFRDRHKGLRQGGAVVFGVSRDNMASHEKFKPEPRAALRTDRRHRREALPHVRRGQEQDHVRQEGQGIERSTFLIDGSGVLRAEWRGIEGRRPRRGRCSNRQGLEESDTVPGRALCMSTHAWVERPCSTESRTADCAAFFHAAPDRLHAAAQPPPNEPPSSNPPTTNRRPRQTGQTQHAEPHRRRTRSPAVMDLFDREGAARAPVVAAPRRGSVGALPAAPVAPQRVPRTPADGPASLFVLDTNVLMHDPMSLFRFEEHDIYLPMITLEGSTTTRRA